MDNPHHHRRSIRLKGYDYTQAAAYFITLCTWQSKCLFGEVVRGEMRLNQAGRIVEAVWQQLASQFRQIRLDEFCVMPNHFHGIILISSVVGATRLDRFEDDSSSRNLSIEHYSGDVGSPRPARDSDRDFAAARPKGPQPGSIGAMIGQYKSRATRLIRKLPGFEKAPIWQRNYYEHIIRNEPEWKQIIQYIQGNPVQWEDDRLHPDRLRK